MTNRMWDEYTDVLFIILRDPKFSVDDLSPRSIGNLPERFRSKWYATDWQVRYRLKGNNCQKSLFSVERNKPHHPQLLRQQATGRQQEARETQLSVDATKRRKTVETEVDGAPCTGQ